MNDIMRDTLDQTAKLVGAVDRYLAGDITREELQDIRNEVVNHLLTD